MSANYLSKDELSLSILELILYVSGRSNNCRFKNLDNDASKSLLNYWNSYYRTDDSLVKLCNKIVGFLIAHTINPESMDELTSIETALSSSGLWAYRNDAYIYVGKYGMDTIHVTKTHLEDALVWFSKSKHLLWEASSEYPNQKSLPKHYFVKQLDAENLIVYDTSAADTAKTTSGTSTSNTTNNTATNSTTNNVAAQQTAGSQTFKAGGYKTLGPQSGNIPSQVMLSTPGQPVEPPGTLYWVIADKLKTNTPRIFVSPVNENRTTPPQRAAMSNGKLKLKWGSGNGYSDCNCYFRTQNEAEATLQGIIQKITQQGYQNARVESVKINKKGYWVLTETFDAFITTSKLNESLDEDIED